MRRQSVFYAIYAALGASLVAYLVPLCMVAWQRFGWSVTFAIFSIAVAVIAALAAICAWLAFVFRTRAVSAITAAPRGCLLVPAGSSFPAPVQVECTRVVRVIGEQFSCNEAAPAFTLFAAAGKRWVTPTTVLTVPNQGGSSEAELVAQSNSLRP